MLHFRDSDRTAGPSRGLLVSGGSVRRRCTAGPGAEHSELRGASNPTKSLGEEREFRPVSMCAGRQTPAIDGDTLHPFNWIVDKP
jgi:hypothetical protein